MPKKLLKEITKRLVDEFKPEEIILFGSYVWGTPDENSDLDILVIVSNSDKSPVQRARRAYRCMRGLQVPKDILVKTRAEVERERRVYASIVSEILERGRLLYGQSKS